MASQWRKVWSRHFSGASNLAADMEQPGASTHRVWLEIVGLASAAACACALLLATLGTAAGAATGEVGTVRTPEPTFEGMVTCSKCEAKHSASLGTTANKCILNCVRSGATFALIDGDRTYQLDGDLVVLKKVAGRRAYIVGAVQGNRIKVSSVAAA